MNPLVDVWLRVVHQLGVEFGVTMLVSGRIVTGLLTPVQRYRRWEREVTTRAIRGRGTFALPSLDLPGISSAEAEEVRKEWPDLKTELDGDEKEQGAFAYLCLRNAQIRDGGQVLRFPMLLVSTQAVHTFMPGVLSGE